MLPVLSLTCPLRVSQAYGEAADEEVPAAEEAAAAGGEEEEEEEVAAAAAAIGQDEPEAEEPQRVEEVGPSLFGPSYDTVAHHSKDATRFGCTPTVCTQLPNARMLH